VRQTAPEDLNPAFIKGLKQTASRNPERNATQNAKQNSAQEPQANANMLSRVLSLTLHHSAMGAETHCIEQILDFTTETGDEFIYFLQVSIGEQQTPPEL
jgi:hypothetical protein